MTRRIQGQVVVFPMDDSYDGTFCMVRGVATADEAVIAANVWSGRADAEVRRQGWCRWVPCYCGDGHRVDITYADGPGRGAFYGYEVGRGRFSSGAPR